MSRYATIFIAIIKLFFIIQYINNLQQILLPK